MSEEEAIENLKEQLNNLKEANECGLATRGELNNDIEAIETVLNMLDETKANEYECNNRISDLLDELKEKDKQIKVLDEVAKDYRAEIEKKDKIIDSMAEHIASSAIADDTVCAIKCDCDIDEDCTYAKTLNCTIKYFKEKVENGN